MDHLQCSFDILETHRPDLSVKVPNLSAPTDMACSIS